MHTASRINKPILRLGSQGTEVKDLQRLLVQYGYEVAVDGTFSVVTEAAVVHFQERFFLLPDGIVGTRTWLALYKGAPIDMPVLRRDSYGRAVKAMQETLRHLSCYAGRPDGDFGIRTETAVRTFQMQHGLIADGVVGSETWHTLSKYPRRPVPVNSVAGC